MPTTPTLTNSFSALLKAAPSPTTAFGKTQTSTPATMPASSGINWNAINIKPAVPQATPTFSLPKATPAVPSLNMGMQTSTPATATPVTNFATAKATPSTSNVQSSDTALRPGQFGAGPFATIAADGSSTPSAYATSAPATPAVPNIAPAPYVQTPSGATANPSTGGIVAPATPQTDAAAGTPAAFGSNTGNTSGAASYSSSAGGAPAVPSYGGDSSYNPLITSQTNEDLFKKYLDSLNQSPEELAAQQHLNDLNTAASQAYTNTQNQPIALPFITGQQAALQRSQTTLAQPLESQIALLQAKRQIASTSSKAALDRADAQVAARRELATKTVEIPFGGNVAQYDATTGGYKALNIAGTGGGDSATVDSWVNLIKGGQAQLSDVPVQLRQGVAQGMSTSPTISKANQDAIAQADTVIQKVQDIIPTINGLNTGAGAYLAGIKGTPQYNLATQLDTIKSNVGFAALQAMRAASPTGGALGQVSEQENRLLQSTLASLDQGQSADQLKSNLAKVQLHFENLKQVLNAPINAQVTYDQDGRVTIKTASGGAFGNTSASNSSSSGSGSGSVYDW